MLIAAIVLFVLAMIFGLVMFSYVLQDQKIPRILPFIHGPLAAAGLTLLIIYAFTHLPYPIAATVLFIFAALGGLTMFYKDLTGKPIPKVLALGHGALAFVAFLFLVIFTLVSPT